MSTGLSWLLSRCSKAISVRSSLCIATATPVSERKRASSIEREDAAWFGNPRFLQMARMSASASTSWHIW